MTDLHESGSVRTIGAFLPAYLEHEFSTHAYRRSRFSVAIVTGGAMVIAAASFALDYVELRHAETLIDSRPMRILAAAPPGNTRPIDLIAT